MIIMLMIIIIGLVDVDKLGDITRALGEDITDEHLGDLILEVGSNVQRILFIENCLSTKNISAFVITYS